MAGTQQRKKAIDLFNRWAKERGTSTVASWQNFQLWCKGIKVEAPAKRLFRDWQRNPVISGPC